MTSRRALAAETICLPDGGHLIIAVQADGSWWPWLAGDPAGRQGCCCAGCAPHEQTGRVTLRYTARCNAPTQAGRPCRNAVTHPGDRCRHHDPGGGVRP